MRYLFSFHFSTTAHYKCTTFSQFHFSTAPNMKLWSGLCIDAPPSHLLWLTPAHWLECLSKHRLNDCHELLTRWFLRNPISIWDTLYLAKIAEKKQPHSMKQCLWLLIFWMYIIEQVYMERSIWPKHLGKNFCLATSAAGSCQAPAVNNTHTATNK